MQLFNPDNEIGYQQTESDGLIDLARQQYGKLNLSQNELGCTLLQIRDVVKVRGSRTGKGFEAYLADIGIPKTTAYRLMKAAETGEPIDYNNEPSATSSRNGTTSEWGDFFQRKREVLAAVDDAVLRGLLTEQWKLYKQLAYSTESDTVKVERYALPMALLEGQIVRWICRNVEVKE